MLSKVACLLSVALFLLTLQSIVQAQGVPAVSPTLQKMLHGLPIEGLRDDVQGMFGALKKTSCGGGLYGCYGTQSDPLQRYFFTSNSAQQTACKWRRAPAWAGRSRRRWNSLGVKADQLTMRAAVVMPIPTDLASGAGTGAGLASALQHGDTMKKAGTDAAAPKGFVEFQFAPNAVLSLMAPKMNLTDASFFLDNELVFGYRGNATFKGADDKRIITHFQTPLTPEGALDFLDFQFYMATPAQFTMEDAAHVMFAMASPDARLAKYGGGFIRSIDSFKNPLLAATLPLSVFQLTNPKPTEYRFGDSTKPFPTDKSGSFNIMIAGPLAPDGPLMHAAGNVRILGQKMGWLDATAGRSGLNGNVGESIVIKLGPLGKLSVKMTATVAIDQGKQILNLLGNLDGQKIAVTLDGSKIGIEVSASCINPFEIKTSLVIKADANIADIFDSQGGANVDPSKISGCIGKDLEAAYNKIVGEYKNLGGYSASLANAELKKISDAADAAAKQAAAAAQKAADDAQRTYDNTKNAARDVANRTSNGATQAFNNAGNAFKRIGKKRKHRQDDHKFAGSVFDWDYYYDTHPDLRQPGVDLVTHWRDSGFREGRRGSLEFKASYYLSRYSDVKKLCGGDYQCALNHWIDYGIQDGRQGSPDFSVVSYMNRYGDVPKTLAKDADPDAMEHWLTVGSDDGRNGRPDNPSNGPISGPTRAGGGGGGAWADVDAGCNNQSPAVFNVQYGRTVQGVQFWYPGVGWAPGHGSLNKYTQVSLDDSDYIVAVDYRSGDSVDSLTFYTRAGKTYGPYGGGGGAPNRYEVTPGERLGCLAGRSGSSIDQLIFSSTGLR